MHAVDLSKVAGRLAKHSVPEPNTGCWLWTGALSKRGYPIVRVADRLHSGSRLACAVSAGRLLAAREVACHRCDQPSCVNPEHLFAATHRANMADMVVKGRSARGGAVAGAKLTEGEVIAVIHLLRAGHTGAAIARFLGTSETAIAKIRHGRSWGHITREVGHVCA